MFYEEQKDCSVQCNLCNHRCNVQNGKRGICGVRKNIGGKLYSLVYGRVVSKAIDPIEKKPLFHFLPSSRAYSIATVGCNFRCMNCQNYDISQISKPEGPILGNDTKPLEVVEDAKRYGCRSIAYTYTEPTVFFEFAYETAKLASKEGIKNVFVTNGYITSEALTTVAHYLDAANIDLKSFSDKFYQKVCGARLEPVLNYIKLYKELGIWIEITTLIIPSYNDSEENLQQIAEFIADLDTGIPWHISRFFPRYELIDLPATPIETLDKARQIGLEAGLDHVYQGNIQGAEGENTYCSSCGRLLIKRYGYLVLENHIKRSECSFCKSRIEGIW